MECFMSKKMFARTVGLLIPRHQLVKCLYSVFSSPKHFDVAIIGGGIMGCSTAYWLKKENPKLNVAVIERDPTYKQCSTVRSCGGLRQNFSVPENIQMSLFSGHIFDNIDRYFSTRDNENIDIQYIKRGYLILSSQEGEEVIRSNYDMQKDQGASLYLLSSSDIKEKWPWMKTEDIKCGIYGEGLEGWFDPWLLLYSVRDKIKEMGVTFIHGTLKEFQGRSRKLEQARIIHQNKQEEEVHCNHVVNATGCWASEIAVLAERATGLSGAAYPLHVQKCKRFVYSCLVADFPAQLTTPMVVDPTGLYFRKENSGVFICGISPDEKDEPNCDDLEVDYEWFDENVWPKLFNRVPLMEALKVKSGWAGFYDYNLKDQNLIIGRHPAIDNLFLCNGSSGHGIQHAMAIGRANMELIVHGKYKTINLDRLSYNRFITNDLVFENNIF